MKRSIYIFATDPNYARAWQALSIGVTAAAMGSAVTFVFAFEALVALAHENYGRPSTPFEAEALRLAEAINAPSCDAMMRDARALGARLVACETVVRLSGLDGDALVAAKVLDAVHSLPQIWREAADAQVFNF